MPSPRQPSKTRRRAGRARSDGGGHGGGGGRGGAAAASRLLLAVVVWAAAIAAPFLIASAVEPKGTSTTSRVTFSSSGTVVTPTPGAISASAVDGGAPQSLFRTANLAKLLAAVRARLGAANQITQLSIYPGFLTISAPQGNTVLNVYASYDGTVSVSRQAAAPPAGGALPLDAITPEQPDAILARIASGAHVSPAQIRFLLAVPGGGRLTWQIYPTAGAGNALYFSAHGATGQVREILRTGRIAVVPGT